MTPCWSTYRTCRLGSRVDVIMWLVRAKKREEGGGGGRKKEIHSFSCLGKKKEKKGVSVISRKCKPELALLLLFVLFLTETAAAGRLIVCAGVRIPQLWLKTTGISFTETRSDISLVYAIFLNLTAAAQGNWRGAADKYADGLEGLFICCPGHWQRG